MSPDPEERAPVQYTGDDLVGRVASPHWLSVLTGGLGCLLWAPLVALCALSMSLFMHRSGPLDTVEALGAVVGMFVAPIALYIAGGRLLQAVSARLTDGLIRRLRRRIERSRRDADDLVVIDDARAVQAGRVTFEGEAGEALRLAPHAPPGAEVLAWQRSVRPMEPEVPADLSLRPLQSHVVRAAGGDFWLHDAVGGCVLVRAEFVLVAWEGTDIEVRRGDRLRVSGVATWREADAGYRGAPGCWEIGGRLGDPVVITVVRSESTPPTVTGVRIESDASETVESDSALRNPSEARTSGGRRG